MRLAREKEKLKVALGSSLMSRERWLNCRI